MICAHGEIKMSESILTSVKKALTGVTEDYEAFDDQLMLYINGTFSILNQLGVGPDKGYQISTGEETWADYLGENETMLALVKPFVVNSVKLAFDPPSSSFVLSSLERQNEVLTWRIRVMIDTINE
jgi:hypothetical protein